VLVAVLRVSTNLFAQGEADVTLAGSISARILKEFLPLL
jgi:hypothetical protein